MSVVALREHESRVVALSTRAARALATHPVASISVSPTPDDGMWTVRAGSMVGVVAAGDTTVVIEPKIPMESVLVLMAATPPSEKWLTDEAGLGESPDLLRLVVHAYATALDRALSRGMRREYREQREELVGLRGRIDIATISRRPFASTRIPCVYDEYTPDTGLNRLLLAAVRRCARVPGVAGTDRTALRRCAAALDGVGDDRKALDWYEKWVPTRLDRHFEQAARLAALILRNMTVNETAGDTRSPTFLVNMNALVEQFIEIRLREALHGVLDVTGQFRTSLDTSGKIAMRPDLVFRRGGELALVADVKYKAVATVAEAARADLYQVTSYATALGLDSAALITCGIAPDLPEAMVVRNAGIRIRVIPVDLGGDHLALADATGALAATLSGLATPGRPLPTPTGA
jgi:5-methylcytosine-specific restriction enzyme subunit McrC